MSQERLNELKNRCDELRLKMGGFDYRSRTTLPATLTTEEKVEYQVKSREYNTLLNAMRVAEERRIRDAKDAELLKQGKTREAANARIAEITETVQALLLEAEEHANEFDLTFQIETTNMSYPLDYDGRYKQYEGWESSNC